MHIYELVGCELDKQNHRHKDHRIEFFATPENIIDYLTKDGKSSCTLSILGHNATDNQYIKEYIGNPDAIIVVKNICEGNPLLGVPACEDECYYYTRKHELKDYSSDSISMYNLVNQFLGNSKTTK